MIFVEADDDARRKRLAANRGWNENELKRREDSQLPLDEKRARSDYVVSNDGDLQELEEQVSRILNELESEKRHRS